MQKKYPYPLTVVMDRYSGIYSGGYFTAWNKYSDEVPEEIHSDDCATATFWEKYHKESEAAKGANDLVGFGETAGAAIEDLIRKQKRNGVFVGV